MKIQNHISFLFITLLFYTCSLGPGSSESIPSAQYNITGTWIGSYSGVMGSGTMKAYLEQAGINVTGTYSATSESDTGSIIGEVDGDEFLVQTTSIPFECITYMKFAIQDSMHMSGYYRSYETCADSGTATLVKQ